MRIIVFILVVIMSGCHNRKTELYTFSELKDLSAYDSIVAKSATVDWSIDNLNISKQILLHYLNEAISLNDGKLCADNPHSSIKVSNLENDMEKLARIDGEVLKNKIVIFYHFEDKLLNEAILVEIREKYDNAYSIRCGVPID